MKKWLVIGLTAVALLAVLFVPAPKKVYNDGGTVEYQALTYKLVYWKHRTDDGVYQATRIYWLGDSHKDLNTLWQEERVPDKFVAKILEVNETDVIVEPMEWEWERNAASRFRIATGDLEPLQIAVGDYVEISYAGDVMESYPAMVEAVSWKLATELRNVSYSGEWMEKNESTAQQKNFISDVKITAIYSDCFFATPVIPMPYTVKLNGQLSGQWCVGDQVKVTYENLYYAPDKNRAEADLLTVEESDFQLDPNACYKPVIYLYPRQEQQVTVRLTLDGELTCTYPRYEGQWQVTAAPDGTLTDSKGQTYRYLYWEGLVHTAYDMTSGFCVAGADTAAFLEQALERLGLNRAEANEFIVYWLPLMEGNPYNIISFQTQCYTDAARLDVEPAPDTVIRVFMAWQGSDEFVELPEQKLTAPEREGFTVVEWGGAPV